MSGWDRIKGQEHIKRYLRSAIEQNDVLHAYIISGEKGRGKKLIADVFSAALLCSGKKYCPCMECEDCNKAFSYSHPDILYVKHEKAGSISVDEVRKQLIMPMAIRPYYGKYKIFIIDDAHLMTQQAQNALLKTLEEPPEYGVVILLTENEEMMLQTILSRTVTLHCGEVSKNDVKKYLIEEKQIPDYKAEVCAKFAQGNIGKAIAMATLEEFYTTKEMALELIKMIPYTDMYELLARVKDISAVKEHIDTWLEFVLIWYHDILLYKANREFSVCLFADEEKDIERQAACLSYDKIEKILKSIENAGAKLNANVNFDLAIEVMLMEIKESYL